MTPIARDPEQVSSLTIQHVELPPPTDEENTQPIDMSPDDYRTRREAVVDWEIEQREKAVRRRDSALTLARETFREAAHDIWSTYNADEKQIRAVAKCRLDELRQLRERARTSNTPR